MPNEVEGSGDVKYHLGASSDREFDGNRVHLSLTANPSHLEIVNPVVLGKVRAKQDQNGATPDDRTMVMPLLMHGDAAFAGQGVVAECFGLSGLKGYRTGGSIHFIVNNQIVITEGEVAKMQADWRTRLDAEYEAGMGYKPNKADWLDGHWAKFKFSDDVDDPRRGNTGAPIETLKEIGRKITAVPHGFHVHKTIQRFLD